jgi:hypothetical protein
VLIPAVSIIQLNCQESHLHQLISQRAVLLHLVVLWQHPNAVKTDQNFGNLVKEDLYAVEKYNNLSALLFSIKTTKKRRTRK